jgi:hypothetical protein
MSVIDDGLDRIRQPEYTGENRCTPCTVVNVAITVVGAAAVALVSVPAAAVAAGVGLATIYFRGYLVPGTPTLTRRYFPDRLLRLFGKGPESSPEVTVDTGDGRVPDVESLFVGIGVLDRASAADAEPTGEPILAADVDRTWRELVARRTDGAWDGTRHAGASREKPPIPDPTPLVSGDAFGEDIDDGDVTIDAGAEPTAHSVVRARVKGHTVARWPSVVAYVADVAGAELLAERDDMWQTRRFDERTHLLGGLRLWLDWCPACGGRVTLGQETVVSCCSEHEVVAATCDRCDVHVLEADLPSDADLDDPDPEGDSQMDSTATA